MSTKSKIYNLIILDESGSMECIRKETFDGCNETIQDIRQIQKKYPDTQEHFVSIYAFQSDIESSRYIIKNQPVAETKLLKWNDYQPGACTALLDAIGTTLTDLKELSKQDEDAIASVTIITDGEENSSSKYNYTQIAAMIEELKSIGWNFNLIGANIDVINMSANLRIDNAYSFCEDSEGTRAMFDDERSSRQAYFERFEQANFEARSCDVKHLSEIEREEIMRRRLANRKQASMGYFDSARSKTMGYTRPDFTPERIDRLQPNEVFVFGSNPLGHHNGGAAKLALKRFGANYGQAFGLHGQSFAIPTMYVDLHVIQQHVNRFIDFARHTPDTIYLVSKIGCGNAGYDEADIAPLFRDAIDLDNVVLPRGFVSIIRLMA